MKLTGNCPHEHCGVDLEVTVRKDDIERHFTCHECGWPILVEFDGKGWLRQRGHWGPAGDDRAFHGLVCDLFHAAMGEVNNGPDCYSGTFAGEDYNHVEAKCYSDPITPSLVEKVFDKYGAGGEASLALVAGAPGFTAAAVGRAAELDVHLFEVRRTKTGYAPHRVG